MALGIARAKGVWRNILLLLVILPFWTSFLLRVYAWIGMMGSNSWFNRGLTSFINVFLPAASEINSVPMMNSNFAVILVVVYSYLPFMILPLFANLEKLDYTLNEAAMDLGSRPMQVFRDVTLPLSMPGIVAGGLLVFIPATGELVIPSLVGNAADPMIGRVINDDFSLNRHWPMASTIAVALLMLLSRADYALQPDAGESLRGSEVMRQRSTFLFSVLCFGFAFFYIPIISMIVFSFNKSRLATVWGSWTRASSARPARPPKSMSFPRPNSSPTSSARSTSSPAPSSP